jgi:hypothetical protein
MVMAVSLFALIGGVKPVYADPHQVTIADCPPGYVLGVQDTAEPLLAAQLPNDPSASPVGDTALAADASASQVSGANARAPRMFITGCIPPSGSLPTSSP